MIASATNKIQVLISGLPQTIPVFQFILSSELLVLDGANLLTLGSDYTVNGGGDATGNVIVNSGGAGNVQVGDTITVMRNVTLTQIINFAATGLLTAAMIGQGFDQLTMTAQQLNEASGRSLRFAPAETLDGTLALASRKGMLLGFDSITGAVVYTPSTTTLTAPYTIPGNLTVNGSITATATAAATVLALTNNGAANYLQVNAYQNTIVTAGSGVTLRRARGTLTASLPVQTGDRLGSCIFSGCKDAANNFNDSCGIFGIAGENFGTTFGAYITFETTIIGGTTRTEKMRIDPAGNVGIGTISPQYNLDVNGQTHAWYFWAGGNPAGGTATDGRIYLVNSSGTVVGKFDAQTGAVNYISNGNFWCGLNPVARTAGDITARRGSNTGIYYFGDNSNNYIYFDGTNYTFGVGNVIVNAISSSSGFGCNGTTPQTAYASGGALAAYGAGTNGFDTAPHASALYAMVVAIRAALVANGIMS